MKVLEIIEIIGSDEPSLIIKYINNALNEISTIANEKINYTTLDIKNGTFEYELPNNYGRIIDLYYLYDDKYYKMSRIENLDVIDDSISSGSSSTSESIIVL